MPVYDTPEPISVVLDVVGGHVLISANGRTDTVVDVRPAEAARMAFVDGTLTVTVATPKTRGLLGLLREESTEVRIDLPAGSHVRGTATGEIHGTGRLGGCRLRTDGGDIRLDETGPAELTSRDGEIHVGRIDGAATITNTNGETWIGEVTGPLRLTDTNGEMVVDHARGDVDGRTAYGEIRIGEVAGGTVSLTTAGGELAVGIAAGTAAWLDIDTAGGELHNELDAAPGPDGSDATVEIRASTGGGDIRIHRSVGR